MDFVARAGLLAELYEAGLLAREYLEAHHRRHIYKAAERTGLFMGRAAECGKWDRFALRLSVYERCVRFVSEGEVWCGKCSVCVHRCLPAALRDKADFIRAVFCGLLQSGCAVWSGVRTIERGFDYLAARQVCSEALRHRRISRSWQNEVKPYLVASSYRFERVHDFSSGVHHHQHNLNALAADSAVDDDGLLVYVKPFEPDVAVDASAGYERQTLFTADYRQAHILAVDGAVWCDSVKAAGGVAVPKAQNNQPVKSLKGIVDYLNKTGGFDAVDNMMLSAAKVAKGEDRKSKSFNEIEILALSYGGDKEAYEVYQDLLITGEGGRDCRVSNGAARLVGLPKYRDYLKAKKQEEAIARGKLLLSKIVVEIRHRILYSVFGNVLPAWFVKDFKAVVFALNEALDGIEPEVNVKGELRPASVCERIVSAGILCLRQLVHSCLVLEAPLAFHLETEGKLDDWIEAELKEIMNRLEEEEEASRPDWLCAPEEVF